jgi:hypothetical protein
MKMGPAKSFLYFQCGRQIVIIKIIILMMIFFEEFVYGRFFVIFLYDCLWTILEMISIEIQQL